jgi:hypothetical protein
MSIAGRVCPNALNTERNGSLELFASWSYIVSCPNLQIIQHEKFFFVLTSLIYLPSGLAIQEISLNINERNECSFFTKSSRFHNMNFSEYKNNLDTIEYTRKIMYDILVKR